MFGFIERMERGAQGEEETEIVGRESRERVGKERNKNLNCLESKIFSSMLLIRMKVSHI